MQATLLDPFAHLPGLIPSGAAGLWAHRLWGEVIYPWEQKFLLLYRNLPAGGERQAVKPGSAVPHHWLRALCAGFSAPFSVEPQFQTKSPAENSHCWAQPELKKGSGEVPMQQKGCDKPKKGHLPTDGSLPVGKRAGEQAAAIFLMVFVVQQGAGYHYTRNYKK